MSLLKKYSNLPFEVKKILINIFLKIILFSLFLLYLCIIIPNNNSSYSEKNTNSLLSIDDESVLDAGTFNTDSYLSSTTIENFLFEFFSTRNQCFLDGSVENLYNFYNIKNNNSKCSLKYEFKRIAYLRDWAIERGIIFTSINSKTTIKDVKSNGTKLTIKALEDCNFTYIYTNSPLDNKFNAQLIHTFTINTLNDKLIIDKDYFLDFFGSELNNYSFSLKEKKIPYSKSMDKNFTANNTLKVNTILNYTKFAFTDHKAEVCGYDNMGYPLVDCSTLKTYSIPFDLGWNRANIKQE
jgi:hypothetical protein